MLAFCQVNVLNEYDDEDDDDDVCSTGTQVKIFSWRF